MLSVIILTFNEERHLERALSSIAPIATEVFVVDSYSTDRTVEIAQAHGAKVLQNKFINQAKQFQWALSNAPLTGDWVMRLDADEVVEADLRHEIKTQLPNLNADIKGITLRRKHIFMGRWIRHGGRYPLILLRLWRRGQARIEDRWMDEHIVLTSGRAVSFQGGFADHSLFDLTEFTNKHNAYATREAIDVLNAKYLLFSSDTILTSRNVSFQAAAKRFFKNSLYNKLPFWMSATLYFSYRYIARLGFLDGVEGLVYHFLQGYWYRMLVGAKVMEFERALQGLPGKAEMLRELERLTGHRLGQSPVGTPAYAPDTDAGNEDLVTGPRANTIGKA